MDKLWLMEIQQTGKRHYSVLPHSAFYILPIQGEKGLNRGIKNVHLPMMTQFLWKDDLLPAHCVLFVAIP